MQQRRTTIAAAMLAMIVPSAHAFGPDSAFIQFGGAEHATSIAAGIGWDFGRSWRLGPGIVGGFWEIALGRWRTTGANGGRRTIVSQIGVTPVFRYQPGDASRWFFELGIGVNFTTPIYESRDKRFSTSFNFGDHIAAGYRFGAASRHEVALRFQHFSNGGIRHPNPGEDFLQLRYTRRFD
jgi:hypothetical protein